MCKSSPAIARRSPSAKPGEGFDAPPSLLRSGSEHWRAVTSLIPMQCTTIRLIFLGFFMAFLIPNSPMLTDTHRLSLIGLCSISMILSYRNYLVYALLTLPIPGRAGRGRYSAEACCCLQRSLNKSEGEHLVMKSVKGEPLYQPLALIMC